MRVALTSDPLQGRAVPPEWGPACASDQWLFHHFFSYTMADMDSFSRVETFWTRRLPQLAVEVPSVRHSVMALAASHLLFLSTNTDPSTPADTESTERLLLAHYNQAITQLTPLFQNPTGLDISHVLVCCLLFVSLESLRGSNSEALRHLESGVHLIAAHAGASEGQVRDLMQELATVFCFVGTDATIFMDKSMLPDITAHILPPAFISDASQPFATLAEAEDALAQLEISISLIDYPGDEDCSGGSQKSSSESESWDPAWERLRQSYREWESRFDRAEAALKASISSARDQERYLRLELERLLWGLTFEPEDESQYVAAYFPKVPDQIDRMLAAGAVSHARYTFRADIVPSVIMAYTCCSDTAVRERLIAQLRSRPRRELVWDSRSVADFLEKDLEDRRAGMKYPPWPEVGPSTKQGALLTLRPRESAGLNF
jgi:hypothetical protein